MEYENIEEDILENETVEEIDLGYNENSTLDDKLDRIEALLNEDINLRSKEDEIVEDLQEYEQQRTDLYTTGSGNNVDVVSPQYSQYIYDLLMDSTIKVEIVENETISEKQLNDYKPIDQVFIVMFILLWLVVIYQFIERHVFKRR